MQGGWLRSVILRERRGYRSLPSSTKGLLLACVALSTVLVWGFRFSPGADLPGHAHLFGLLANYHHPVYGVSGFYDLQPFTPYLFTYLVGALLAKLGGGLFAAKCILFGCALGTPYALLRWLRASGGEVSFAFWGFALAFGYPSMWGFISFVVSLPIALLTFEAWVRAPSGGFRRRVSVLTALLVLLFFAHAMTFALVATCVALLTLLQPRAAFLRRMSALLLPFCLSVTWYVRRGADEGLGMDQLPDIDRFALLFGGELHIFAAFWSAAVGLVMAVVLAALARPVVSTKVERWLPLAVAGLAFFGLPNYLMNTEYVGHRFVYFVHAFLPVALLTTAQGRAAHWIPRVSGLLTVAVLSLCLVRVVGLNRDEAGVAELTPRVPMGSNVRADIPQPARTTRWFGGEQFVGAHGWITAERHGMAHNDHGRYFQLPIRHAADVPLPTHMRYVLSREPGTKSYLKHQKGHTKRIAQADRWSLHEDASAAPFACSVGTILRYGQDYGELGVDRSASKRSLTVDGQRSARGLGTRARSLIQLSPSASGLLEGACGIDDRSGPRAAAVCTILDHEERVLFRAVVRIGEAAARFSVPVRQGENIYLKATRTEAQAKGPEAESAFVDWVDLAIREP